ncbi:MAG TPA: PIG-L family deacetylase [Dehalococcoidia bacterium]|nr:PIG-L family deacetylase [Dehalococcoidia bacterium]
MTDGLTLMAVHAHPDDEAFGSAGTLARYGAEGVTTCLVVATRGEAGEIHDPDLVEEEARPRLGAIREQELRRATEILGITHLDFLGYEDSGMAGTPENDNPRCFHLASLEEATGRLVALIRQYRPQVLLTYGEDGGYNHPDHVRTHLIASAAFQDAGSARRFPDAAAPWQPSKLYGIAFSNRAVRALWEAMRARGIPWPFGGVETGEPPNWGVPEERVTAAIDVAGYVPRTRESLRQHRTQFDPDGAWMTLPDDVARVGLGIEHFMLLRSLVQADEHELDLFAGLRTED